MVDVQYNEDASRFEAYADDVLAGHIVIKARGDVLEMTHTEVDEAFGGRGIGGELVRAAADHARASGQRVAASCSYAEAWLDRHPEYDDIRA